MYIHKIIIINLCDFLDYIIAKYFMVSRKGTCRNYLTNNA